ncbi:protein FAR-RED IMPAIRED RESPONSE 1-like [Cornus florida]|uniref:protein FAR-RED IMPAIRED RESPONSE 1-like n=1 Tax=Cornus florida TaxID=4283 RepID=UPI002898AA67|nr:protein FAR-RED IMPAIRED RESPONSE 1-like [Cornus florida]
MITYYGHFGDVVTFDTTYKLVHGNHPFALFLGVNQHRETAVFGAALMYDEMADSFVWLFDTFLKAMSGKTPKTILIDQDATMVKALMQLKHLCTHNDCMGKYMKDVVMPGTKHHLCTWHLMQNAQKHVGFLFKRDERIKNVISKLMFEIEVKEQFMSEWDSMLKVYDLEYLLRQLILPDFFTHFDRLLSDKRYKEYEAEYRLLQRLPCSDMDNNGQRVYKVTSCNGMQRSVTRTVEDELSHLYGKFEMNGFLCSHILKILKACMNITELPSRYILRRWTRKARDGNLDEILGYEVLMDPKLEVTRRHRTLCHIFTEISSIASEDNEGYNDLLVKAMEWKKSAQRSCSRTLVGSRKAGKKQNNGEIKNSGIIPMGIKTKDTSKGQMSRRKSPIEENAKKKSRCMKRIVKKVNDSKVSGVGGGSCSQTYLLVDGNENSTECVHHQCYMPPPPIMHNRQAFQPSYSLAIHFPQPITLLSNQSSIGDSQLFSSELFSTHSSYGESCKANLGTSSTNKGRGGRGAWGNHPLPAQISHPPIFPHPPPTRSQLVMRLDNLTAEVGNLIANMGNLIAEVANLTAEMGQMKNHLRVLHRRVRYLQRVGNDSNVTEVVPVADLSSSSSSYSF